MACNHNHLFRRFNAKYPQRTPYSIDKLKTTLMPKMASDTGRLLKLDEKYLGKGDKSTVKLRASYDNFMRVMNSG